MILLGASLLFTGAKTRLTKEGETVQMIHQVEIVRDSAHQCQLIRSLKSYSWLGAGLTPRAKSSAINKLKNATAKIGGNVIYVPPEKKFSVLPIHIGARIGGDAYFCHRLD